jgi:hypothetical protein
MAAALIASLVSRAPRLLGFFEIPEAACIA